VEAHGLGSALFALPDGQPIENTHVHGLMDAHPRVMSSRILGILIAQPWSDKHPAPLGLLVGILSANTRQGSHKTLISRYFAINMQILSVAFSVLLAVVPDLHAQGRTDAVIEQVWMDSGEDASEVLIRLTGSLNYKVILIDDREMLVAFKDTRLSKAVFASETIVGDQWVQGIEMAQKPSHVSSVIIRTHEPYSKLKYQVTESQGLLRVEITGKATPHEKVSRQATSQVLTPRGDEKTLAGSIVRDRTDQLLNVESPLDTPDTDLFLEAAKYYQIEQWKYAIRTLKKIIQSYPESRHLERAYFLLAESYHRMFEEKMSEHFMETIKYYQGAISRFPTSEYVPDAMLSMGNCYFKAKNYYEAMAYFNLVLDQHKDHPAAAEALLQRGRILALNKQPQRAMIDFEELEKGYPKTRLATLAKIEMAKALFGMQSFKRSLRTLDEVIDTEPDEVYKNPDILLYAGYDYYELGQLREAREVFSKLLNYYPEVESNHLVLTRIADIYRDEGEEHKASKLYALVASTYPETEGGLISLLRLAHIDEKTGSKNPPVEIGEGSLGKTAHDIYEQVIKKYPDNPLSQLAMLRLAALQQKHKDYELSITTLRKILEKHPDTSLRPEVTSVLQASLKAFLDQEKQAGNIGNITRYYEQMKAVLPFEDMPDFLSWLGDTYRAFHQYGPALSMFRQASQYYANQNQSADILFGLGECAYREKRSDEAEKALQAFVTEYPERREASKAHYWLGLIFSQRQQYDEAFKALTMALQLETDKYHQAKVRMALASVSSGQGDYERAAEALREAITLLKQNKDSASEDLYMAYRELGETYVKLRHNEKAVPIFQKALELLPEGSDSHSLQFRLAQCYQWLKATDKAEAMLNGIMASGDPFWSKVAQVQIKEMNMRESVEKLGYELETS
jgi:TolA-binding protein